MPPQITKKTGIHFSSASCLGSTDSLCSTLNATAHGEKVNFLPSSEKNADTDIKEATPRDPAKKPAQVGLKLLTQPFANLLEK